MNTDRYKYLATVVTRSDCTTAVEEVEQMSNSSNINSLNILLYQAETVSIV